jgi:hypothetical protein
LWLTRRRRWGGPRRRWIGVDAVEVDVDALHLDEFDLVALAADYAPSMLDLFARHAPDLVIPTVSDELPQIAVLAELLGRTGSVAGGQGHVVGSASGPTSVAWDKLLTMWALERAGVPIPGYTPTTALSSTAFRRTTGRRDWPRTTAGLIDESDPSIGIWGARVLAHLLSRARAEVRRVERGTSGHRTLLAIDAKVDWEHPGTGRPM